MSLERYHELTSTYEKFIYESYQVEEIDDRLMLHFQYRITSEFAESIVFNHRVSYQLKSQTGKQLNLALIKDLDALIFSIGMVESINYYKTICPRAFYVNCGRLTKEQKLWWQKLFYNGLGEFIYLNGLAKEVSMTNFVTFYSDETKPNTFEDIELNLSGNLIPVGGGKDSVVTIELLKGMKEDNLCFVMSPPQAAYDCIEVAGYTDYLLAKRHFDKRMMTMNAEGFMNGHVPFSAILGFISILGAALTGKQYIPLSNERSANESTVIGESFNHQYSKSYEFELDFNTYVNEYLVQNVSYFSLLRPLYEVEIAQRFAQHKHYHQVFRSCNRGKKTNEWCGVCSKCLFVYIILAPFLSKEALDDIFGKALLEDPSLEPIFLELIGDKDVKPFECVGTIDEVRLSMKKIIEQNNAGNKALSYLEKVFLDKVKLETINELDVTVASNMIPEAYKTLLKE